MPPATRRFLLPSLLIALLAGLMFTPGLPGEFVFDDIPNIENNAAIQMKQLGVGSLYDAIATPQMSGNMRTLPTLTFALDYWRAGGTADPATFKTTNILIHAFTTLALAWLFLHLLRMAGTPARHAQWIAPTLALAWALHPLQVSSVLYAVQRLQTMATLFLVLALWAYLKARQAQMDAKPSRTWWMLTALLWTLALGCKEDSVQFPAYALALELTVLRFGAADPGTAKNLRRGYIVSVLLCALFYLFFVLPNHWHWDAYDGRNFSSEERLLTQARVLCMYLWQFAWPQPSHMPFYYDWLQPSRGLLQPWTTLASILFLASVFALAWHLRHRRSLFALGVFLFFGAHAVTSNVIGLELAFEHRNSFALIGAVLAIGSLLATVAQRLQLRTTLQAILCCALLTGLGSATAIRAHTWSSNHLLALAATQAAPHSARAWVELCAGHFRAGGGPTKENTRLDQAISACSAGSTEAPYLLNNTALLIVLKTLRGNVSQDDWALLQHRLETVDMNWDNQRALKILTYHFHLGVPLDRQQLLKALKTLSRRMPPIPHKYAEIGYYVMNEMNDPDLAMPYFVRAIEVTTTQDPFPQQLAAELRDKDRPDLAETIERIGSAHSGAPPISGSN